MLVGRAEFGIPAADESLLSDEFKPVVDVLRSHVECRRRREQESLVHLFGFVSVENGNDATVHRFEPSGTVVEIAMELSGLSIGEARKRFKEVLAEVDTRADRDDLLVYPEVRGEIPFSPILLADVADEFSDHFVTDIKSDAAEKVPPELEGTEPATSTIRNTTLSHRKAVDGG